MSKRLILLSCSAAFGLACGPNDADIASAVERNLSAEVDLQGNVIDVSSVDGEVTLMGSVDSTAERARAQSVAQAVDGVKTVRNQLGVEDAALLPRAAETPPVAAPPPTEPTAPGESTTPPPMDPAVTPPPDPSAPENTTPAPAPESTPADPTDESTGS